MKIRIYLSQTDYEGFSGYYSYQLSEPGWYLVSKNPDTKLFFDMMNELDNSFSYEILNTPFEHMFTYGMNSVIFRSNSLTEDFCMYLVLKGFIEGNQILKDGQ